MNTHDPVYLYLHWFWTAFFALFGLYLMLRPRCLTQITPKMFRIRACADRARLVEAVLRRRAAEQPSAIAGYSGAAAAFVLTGASVLNVLQPSLLYGIFCMILGLTSAAVYLQLRNAQPKRIAVLAARSAGAVIPPWIFACAVLSGLLLLSYVPRADLAVSAVVVCISTLVTVAAAWRLTKLPAMLQGVDVPMETYIDDHLRFSRSSAALIFSLVQPFVFCTQALVHQTALQLTALLVSTVSWIGVSLWISARLLRSVTPGPPNSLPQFQHPAAD